MTGEALKRRRKAFGLTQAELAKKLGVSWSAVARWETGQRRVPRMAEILLGYIEGQKHGTARRRTR
jgi:transcriptional regulator with XRE-family HTH domain